MNMLTSIFKRQCNGCHACCTAIAVAALRKPFNYACKHETQTGCGIYGKHPEDCKGYSCLWLLGLFDMKDKPNESGILFHPALNDDILYVDAYILRDGVDEIRLKALIHVIHGIFPEVAAVRLVRYDQVVNVDFTPDEKDYPGGGNVGNGTLWDNYGSGVMSLNAPTRKPLPMVN